MSANVCCTLLCVVQCASFRSWRWHLVRKQYVWFALEVLWMYGWRSIWYYWMGHLSARQSEAHASRYSFCAVQNNIWWQTTNSRADGFPIIAHTTTQNSSTATTFDALIWFSSTTPRWILEFVLSTSNAGFCDQWWIWNNNRHSSATHQKQKKKIENDLPRMCTVRYMFFVFEKSNFIISILFRLIINNSNRLQHFVLICVLNNLSLVLVFISTLAIYTVFHYNYHCHHHHVYLRTNTPFKSSDIFF